MAEVRFGVVGVILKMKVSEEYGGLMCDYDSKSRIS